MPLTFHPHPGMVLICDFNTGFKAPEMIKRRPVVVISPRPRRSNQLCTIAPNPVEPFHHRMDPRSLPGKLARKENWAKCDMLAASTKKTGIQEGFVSGHKKILSM